MSFIDASGLEPAIALLVAVTLIAGLARGFSGFGGALIFMPLASALVGPKIASIALLLADMVMTAPLLRPAFRSARRRDVFTMLIGALVVIILYALLIWRLPPPPTR